MPLVRARRIRVPVRGGGRRSPKPVLSSPSGTNALQFRDETLPSSEQHSFIRVRPEEVRLIAADLRQLVVEEYLRESEQQ